VSVLWVENIIVEHGYLYRQLCSQTHDFTYIVEVIP
jgi:hypothetical protein